MSSWEASATGAKHLPFTTAKTYPDTRRLSAMLTRGKGAGALRISKKAGLQDPGDMGL